MSDDAPKKRAWFQIHLSTAIVLMVVAGVLVWVNVIDRSFSKGSYFDPVMYGWPLPAYGTHEKHLFVGRLDAIPFTIDFAVALAILTAVAASCEYLIRRREKVMKKPNP